MEPSPDGKLLAFLGATALDDPLAQSVFVVPLAGGTPRNLTVDYEGSATDLGWLDASTLLVVAIERESTVVWRVDAASGKREKLAGSGLIVHSIETAPGRSRIALVAESREHPAEVFDAEPGRAPRRLTRHAAPLEGLRLARQESVRWRGAGGLDISGVLTWPLDPREGEKRPLVLQIHGGPEGTSLDGWTTSALYPVQLLAARGYFVLQPNYRGSGGRGVAFSKADHDDLGGREFEDVLAGVDELVRRGLVDAQRVGTGGWSYGGYLSAWAATRHSERFAAAIPCAGLTKSCTGSARRSRTCRGRARRRCSSTARRTTACTPSRAWSCTPRCA
jgi:dipeptidyl aminopeptidase/acylaminoacyl peptidase